MAVRVPHGHIGVVTPPPLVIVNTARSLLDRHAGGRVLIVPDGDADGLTSAALAWRHVLACGGTPQVLHPARGEHAHSPVVRQAIAHAGADLVLVLDQGSRAGTIAPGTPTLVIDHHRARGVPDGAVFVSGADRDDIASTSELAWRVFDGQVHLAEHAWIGALGALADGGRTALSRWAGFQIGTKKALSGASSRINAANRSAGFEVGVAFRALLSARSASDIVEGRSREARRLDELRLEVQAEVDRCSRTAPKVSGRFALILFRSGARVHPLVAQRWTQRLRDRVVIAANGGFLPGRVNFAMRSALDVDLLELLQRFNFPSELEVGHGHRKATGGSLPDDLFSGFVTALGFTPPPGFLTRSEVAGTPV